MDKGQMISDIKTMMGYPTVRLEISDTQIENLIDRAYKIIKPYITDRTVITIPAAPCTDLSEYKVVDIVRVYPTTVMNYYNGSPEILFDFQKYQPLGNSMQINVSRVASASAEDYDIPFRFIDNKLYLSSGNLYGSVSIECFVDNTLDKLQDERAIMWIQSYSEALVKEVLGRIRGKYKSSNLPVEIDADTLLSEAQSEKERLESQLYDQEYGQFFILR